MFARRSHLCSRIPRSENETTSRNAAEICTREGVGYVDLAGNCRLALGQIYIERTGKPNAFARKRDFRSLYSPKAARVLRALLVEPKRYWQVQELARVAQVSLGQASNVKCLLRDREWLEAEHGTQRFRAADPAALLTEWSQQARPGGNILQKFYSLSPLSDIEHDLAAVCEREHIPYALTALSAAARYASYVRAQRASAYVSGDFDPIAGRLGWKRVESGANITLIRPNDDGVYYGSNVVDGVCTVSPVQAYLDLAGTKGREREAADYLLREAIEPTWKKDDATIRPTKSSVMHTSASTR